MAAAAARRCPRWRRHPAVALPGSAIIRSSSLAVAPPRRRPGGRARPARRAAAPRARREPARARPSRACAGRRRRRPPTRCPRRGKAEAKSSPSSRSSGADLAPQVARARGARVARDRRVGCGRPAGAPVTSRRLCSSSSGTCNPPSGTRRLRRRSLRRAVTLPPASHSASSTAIVGDAPDLDRDQQRALGLRARRRARSPVAPKSSASGRSLVGDHQRARRAARRAGPRAPRPASVARIPGGPRPASASKARSATPDSTIAIVSASSSRLWLLKPPVPHPLQRELLDRGPLLVGVEPDVAEEDAVGPGDRLLAQVDRLAAGEAVGEHAADAP